MYAQAGQVCDVGRRRSVLRRPDTGMLGTYTWVRTVRASKTMG